jgi:L-asparagine transporter-like permease
MEASHATEVEAFSAELSDLTDQLTAKDAELSAAHAAQASGALVQELEQAKASVEALKVCNIKIVHAVFLTCYPQNFFFSPVASLASVVFVFFFFCYHSLFSRIRTSISTTTAFSNLLNSCSSRTTFGCMKPASSKAWASSASRQKHSVCGTTAPRGMRKFGN